MLDELLGSFDPYDTFQDYMMFTPKGNRRNRPSKLTINDLKHFAITLGAFWILSVFI